jgi:sucrose-6-phosphate hydrolase SacC (GH32 family)
VRGLAARLLATSLLAASLLIAAERFRPLAHFSPARNWTNDPCGIVAYDGEYHLSFPIQSSGRPLGAHELGARGEPRPNLT